MPTIVPAPTLPAVKNRGIKMSKPGVSVFTATEAQIYQTSRKKKFKIKIENQVSGEGWGYHLGHELGYLPLIEAFAKDANSKWFRLPLLNLVGGDPYGFWATNDAEMNIFTAESLIYYYIFVDRATE